MSYLTRTGGRSSPCQSSSWSRYRIEILFAVLSYVRAGPAGERDSRRVDKSESS